MKKIILGEAVHSLVSTNGISEIKIISSPIRGDHVKQGETERWGVVEIIR